MNIKCKHCGEYFFPCDETIAIISEGWISPESVNICDDCWDMIQLSEFALTDLYSDADPGL